MRSLSKLVEMVRGPRRTRRGSAIITVILVLLILTVVGLGIAYFTKVEDAISGNDRLQKTGFYAAEAGLRTGEEAIKRNVLSQTQLNTLLDPAQAPTPVTGLLTPPGGGFQAVILRAGTPTVIQYYQVRFSTPATTLLVRNEQAIFSVYVRNNVDDPGGATQDQDQKINLISVGQVAFVGSDGTTLEVDGSGVARGAITRILEEQLAISFVGAGDASGKNINQGGTSQITIN